MISIIILTYNEAACIEKTLQNLKRLKCKMPVELILADGGSTDNTVETAKKYARIVSSEKGKAKQMNAAAKAANGKVLFFIHADMVLHNETLEAICKQMEEGFDGGGFSNVFDEHNSKIKQLGTILNFRFLNGREQSDRNIFYGDNGIFVRKEVFEKLGGFKDLPIMEDFDFSVRMRSKFKVRKIQEPKLIVSARRHIKAGFLKTRLQWIVIKKLYLLGVSPSWLARWYKDVR